MSHKVEAKTNISDGKLLEESARDCGFQVVNSSAERLTINKRGFYRPVTFRKSGEYFSCEIDSDDTRKLADLKKTYHAKQITNKARALGYRVREQRQNNGEIHLSLVGR